MTYRVDIDENLCNSYGNCVVAAPEIFDLDDETNIAVVQPGHPADDEALREAAADCPARAITLQRVGP
ncbi:ferredoxin [Cryptosporangium sp. NPDC048952]|uniref:ferredoxin n=1 Tax=Cryptosporangium sp. NPDC048952 TaxID=3363961 RepID=UPI0037215991